jgi:tetratricopeptide (TPR) repeat protein
MDQDTLTIFGNLIKSCRNKLDLSQEKLGEEIGYHGSYVSKIERGHQKPKLTKEVAVKFINFFRQSGAPEELISNMSELANHLQGWSLEEPLTDPELTYRINQGLASLTSDQRKIAARLIMAMMDTLEDIFIGGDKNNSDRKWQLAMEHYDSADKREGLIDHEMSLYIHAGRGASLYRLGMYDEAIQDYQRVRYPAQSIIQEQDILIPPELKTKAHKEEANSYLEIGNIRRRKAEWGPARKQYEAAKKFYPDDRLWIGECDRRIAGVDLFQARSSDAEALCQNILQNLPETALHGKLKTLQHLAWAYKYQGRWDEAIQLYKDASQIAEQTLSGDELVLENVRSWRYQADVYSLHQEWYDEAEKLYAKALKNLKDFKEKKGRDELILLRGMNLLGLGHIYSEQSQKEYEALNYLNESEDLNRRLKETLTLARVYIAKAKFFIRNGRFSNAEANLRNARDYLEAVGNPYYFGEYFVTSCKLYYEKREFNRIYQTVEEDIKLFEKDLYLLHTAHIQLITGKVYLYQDKDFRNAFQSFNQATWNGLAYNKYVFWRVFRELLTEIDQLISVKEFEKGNLFCQQYKDYWQDRIIKPEVRSDLRRSLELIDQKEREITGLIMRPDILTKKRGE